MIEWNLVSLFGDCAGRQTPASIERDTISIQTLEYLIFENNDEHIDRRIGYHDFGIMQTDKIRYQEPCLFGGKSCAFCYLLFALLNEGNNLALRV